MRDKIDDPRILVIFGCLEIKKKTKQYICGMTSFFLSETVSDFRSPSTHVDVMMIH